MVAPTITAAAMKLFAPSCDAEGIAPSLQHYAERHQINTRLRVCHWMAQLHHESNGFTRLVESLNYSAKRLTEVWPARFPTLVAAKPYAHNARALANKTYGGRLGNTEPDDGWRYRGRGWIQLTGKANYETFGKLIGVDLVKSPEMAGEPDTAARLAAAYWASKGLNALADKDELATITKRINGGLNGLADRRHQLVRAKVVWK